MLKIVSVSVLCLLSLSLLSAQSEKTPGNELKIKVEEFQHTYEDQTLKLKIKVTTEGCTNLRMHTVATYSTASTIVDIHKLVPGELEEWSFKLPKIDKGANKYGKMLNFDLGKEVSFNLRCSKGDKSTTHTFEKKLW